MPRPGSNARSNGVGRLRAAIDNASSARLGQCKQPRCSARFAHRSLLRGLASRLVTPPRQTCGGSPLDAASRCRCRIPSRCAAAIAVRGNALRRMAIPRQRYKKHVIKSRACSQPVSCAVFAACCAGSWPARSRFASLTRGHPGHRLKRASSGASAISTGASRAAPVPLPRARTIAQAP